MIAVANAITPPPQELRYGLVRIRAWQIALDGVAGIHELSNAHNVRSDFRRVLRVIRIVPCVALGHRAVEWWHRVAWGPHGSQGFLSPWVLGAFLDNELIRRCSGPCLTGNEAHATRVLGELCSGPTGLDECSESLALLDRAQ